MPDERIYKHPYLSFDRGSKIRFEFCGHEYDAYENETIGAALVAAGVNTVSRSFKYHRPRGFLCFTGRCPNCMAEVNGVPNVRICREKVSEGAVVRPQNVFPSVQFDLYSVMDRLDFLFPVGFQYKRFIRPRFLWRFYERMIRSTAGIGRLPAQIQTERQRRAQTNHVQTDVAVVGGGPAGISAAIAAAGVGARVVLIDEGNELGGHLRWDTCSVEDVKEFSGLRAFEVAKKLATQSLAFREIKVYAPATAFGIFSEGVMAVESSSGLTEITPKRYVFATGCTDGLPLFYNNDIPGIMTLTAARVLLHHFGVRPGKDIAVYCNSSRGFALASQLLDAEMLVKAVVDERRETSLSNELETLYAKDVPVHFGAKVVQAFGRNRLDSIEIATEDGEQRRVSCDTLCCSVGRQALCELAQQAGCKLAYDPRSGFATAIHDEYMQSAAQSYVAGEMLGTKSLAMTLCEGRLAGLSAALSIGLGGPAQYRERVVLKARTLRDRKSWEGNGEA